MAYQSLTGKNPKPPGAVRQQAPEAVFGKMKPALPAGDTYGTAQPVRKPS